MVGSEKGVDGTVEEVFRLLEQGGNSFYGGDPITKLDHSVQTAYLARLLADGELALRFDIERVGKYKSELLEKYAALAGLQDIRDPFIVAGLLHDIGHLLEDPELEQMGEFGTKDHERHGADHLRKLGFSVTVVELVGGHVPAKLYLAENEPAYAATFSPASRATFQVQSNDPGVFKLDFANDPLAAAKVTLRLLDEEAKLVGRQTDPLEHYRSLLVKDLRAA